jgi:hypothetical protein
MKLLSKQTPLQVDWPAPQEGAAEEVEVVMLPFALVLIEVVLCAAAKAARAVTRTKRMLVELWFVWVIAEGSRGVVLVGNVGWKNGRKCCVTEGNQKTYDDRCLCQLTHVVAVLIFTRTTRPAKLVPDKFAGIKDDLHVADILSVSETARLIAGCCHAAWPQRTTQPCLYSLLECKSVTRIAMEMHSASREWEASIENCDTIGSPWTCLPFGKNYASW